MTRAMLRSLGLIAIALLVGSATAGPTEPQSADPRNGGVLSKMIYTDIDVPLEAVPVSEVVELIAAQTGVTVRLLKRTESRPNGIDPALLVTLPASHRPALNLLQDALAQCSKPEPCTWQVRHGSIEVSTKEALGTTSMQTVRVLPIEDQLIPIPDYNDPPNLNLGGGSGGGSGGGGAMPGDDLETRRAELMEVLTRNIEPKAWKRYGGNWAEMQPFNRSLVIRAPRWIHRQINGFDFRIPVPQGNTPRVLRFEGSDVRVEIPLTERLRYESESHS
ncbi:MAG: hypothetical protein GY894_08445 [Planctomycetes bacterium]|nr:hypothetical protein [Planctomycetota bacterium]